MNEAARGSMLEGLVGVEGGFILLEQVRLGGGYVSPRASAAAFRLSDSALLGRPRLRGGSPRGGMLSEPGDNRADATLSVLNEAVQVVGRGCIARGARIGLSEGKRRRFRVWLLSSIGAGGAEGSWREGGRGAKLGLRGN